MLDGPGSSDKSSAVPNTTRMAKYPIGAGEQTQNKVQDMYLKTGANPPRTTAHGTRIGALIKTHPHLSSALRLISELLGSDATCGRRALAVFSYHQLPRE